MKDKIIVVLISAASFLFVIFLFLLYTTSRQKSVSSISSVPTQPTQYCHLNDKAYAVGESFKSADGCNTCSCAANFQIACTEMACVTPTSTFKPSPTSTSTISATQKKDWKTCTDSINGFSIKYPQNYSFNQTTCDFNPPYNATITDDGLIKEYVISITVDQSSLDLAGWIKQKALCPDFSGQPSCSESKAGPIVGSVQIDALNRHYAGIDTIVKNGNKIIDITLGAREPNAPISAIARQKYNQIVSTLIL